MNHDYIRSITKKYHNEIWGKFIRAIHEYKLIAEGDKIAVCVSGGKDSFCLALCMRELQRQSELAGREKFDVIYLCMNPGYSAENMKIVRGNAKRLGIPLTFFKSNIFSVVEKAGGSPCYLCAKMRRGNLYAKAKELGCNKIALAHHFDDTIETIMLNMLYQGRIQTMMPKIASANFAGMHLIRPMCLVREFDIIKWKTYNELEFIACACPLTKNKCNTGKRAEIKTLLGEIEKIHPIAPTNIYNSVNKINLNAVLGYYRDGVHTDASTLQ